MKGLNVNVRSLHLLNEIRKVSWKMTVTLRSTKLGVIRDIPSLNSIGNICIIQCIGSVGPSPRMGHTLGEIFTHAQSLNLKNRNSWAGCARRSPRALQRAEPAPARSQRAVVACKLRLKLLLADQPAIFFFFFCKEDLKADRRVRHYKEVGLPEWPLAGRATVPRGLWYRSLHVSSSERFFQKVYGRPAPVDLTIHTVSHGWQNRRSSFLAVVARFGKRWEFGDNREVCKAFVCQYAPPRLCCSWGPAEAKRCMPAPRRPLDGQCDGDVIDAEFALRRCHLSSTEQIFFHLHSSLKT